VGEFQRRLLAWYGREARPLAWRTTRDPYRILVSEIMLQQTQASRVEPAFLAFCDRFPTVRALAAAPLADVLTAWRGLGYNRRARNLHLAAQAIVERPAGEVPAELAALRALPGVGEYTARAVLAFAFHQDAAPVDTNVRRVLARAVAGAPLSARALQALADELVPPGAAGAWASALMDLGARHCTARAPRCAGCPVTEVCAWRRDREAPDPAAGTRRAPQPPFAASDRYHRGRLVDALRRGALAAEAVPAAAYLADDPPRAGRLAERLVADGLAEWRGDGLSLPSGPSV
jgi:A/G-specific adenine glycosylase